MLVYYGSTIKGAVKSNRLIIVLINKSMYTIWMDRYIVLDFRLYTNNSNNKNIDTFQYLGITFSGRPPAFLRIYQ